MKKTNKFLKQSILILFSMIIVFSNFSIVNAAVNTGNEITPYYTTISYNTVYFKINGIKASCSASLEADHSTSLKITMELQKKKSGGYETIESWTASKTSVSLAISKSRNINVFCTYRLKVTFVAGTEKTTVYKYPS